MKILFLLPLLLIISSCNKPKTVFICGDHVCVNKSEAELYFKENLSIEVKILKTKVKEENDLVELNLNNKTKDKKISVEKKSKTNKIVKDLSKEQIKKIKSDIKKKKSKKMITKKIEEKKLDLKNNENIVNKENKIRKIGEKEITKNKIIADICPILKDCNIDEISKFLVKEGNKKKFPNISQKE